MFNLSPIYSARKSSNHKLSINTKSVLTQIYIKQSIHKHRTQNFRRISPFGITPVKKKHADIVDHSVDLSIPDFFLKSVKKKKKKKKKKKEKKRGMDRSNEKL